MRVSELYGFLAVFASQESDIVLLGNEVERVDATGIQLLISFKQAVEAKGHQVSLNSPSSSFEEVISGLGLAEALGATVSS